MAKKALGSVSKEGQVVKFTLDVTSIVTKGIVTAIDIDLNLNPDGKILQIEEKLSTSEALNSILDEVKGVIKKVQIRTDNYNSVIKIDEKKYDRLFYPGYKENITPSFGKIDNIRYSHNSPEHFTSSYAKSCNGDQKPPA